MILSSVIFWIKTVLFPSYHLPIQANTTFSVIGVGLSRTGTLSTRVALSQLLGGKIYHGYESDMDPRADFWLRAAQDINCINEDDWREFLSGRGYTGGVGEPLALFYKEISEAYPEAKFLLTTRDPVKWYKSMKKAIIEPRSYLETPPISWIFNTFGWNQNKQMFLRVRSLSAQRLGMNYTSWSAVYAGEKTAVDFFNQWNTAIMKTIPKERLLVYRVEEGWKPLANFLGLPEPEVPFPSVNDGATVTVIIVGGYYLLMLGLPLLLVSLLCWRWRRRLRKATNPAANMYSRLSKSVYSRI